MDGPWKVYFELNGKTDDDVVKFLQENVDTRSIWYIHPSGKVKGPHCHGLVYDHRQTAETFRNKIKKYFNLVTQGSFAISNKYERGTVMADGHTRKYITYMSKGKYDPIMNIGYDQDNVNTMRSEWREPTSVHISGDLTVITSGEVKSKRITTFTITQEVKGIYMDTHDSAHMLLNGLVIKDIEKIVVDTCHKYSKNCPPRLCADIIGDICSQLAPNHYHSQVKRYLGIIPGLVF